MKALGIILVLIVAVAIFIFINTCTGKKKVASYTTACGDNTLTLEVYEQQQYAYSYHFLLIRYPNIRPIRINPRDITDNRIPDKKDLYDSVPHVKLETAIRTIAVQNSSTLQLDTINRFPFIIYLDPDQYTKQQFEAVGQCMAESWKTLDDSLYNNFISPQHHLNYPQLMGLVYGKRSDFVHQFHF